MRKLLCVFMGCMIIAPTLLTGGTDSTTVGMADGMRSEGKIYVVIGVLAIIFVVIAAYLWRMDMRIRNIEKQK